MVNTAINGTNDAAVLSSAVVALAETNAALATSGTLAIADVDNPALFTAQTNVVGTNGTFSVTAAGAWSYTANAAFDGLNVGQSVSDTFTVAAVDGTATTVKVTINGTNDAPIISVGTTATGAIAEQTGVTGSTLLDTATGAIRFNDIDLGTHTATITSVTATGVTNGLPASTTLLALLRTGAVTEQSGATAGSIGWTFSAADSTFDYLAAGETATLTYAVQLSDNSGGTALQNIAVTITGTNDAPTAAAVAASTQQNVIVKIAFVGADIDHADVLTYQVVTGPSLGTATVNADGTFTFDPGHAFDALATGEQQTVTFTYQATDKLGNL